jgi:UDP-3-O-[3-hydroxymyristoyl] glucosamine N-acyltransferase
MKRHLKLGEVAQLTSSKLIGNPEEVISGVDVLEQATPNDLSFFTFFLGQAIYLNKMKASKAGAIFVPKTIEHQLDPKKNYLIHEDPSKAFQQMAEIFCNQSERSGFKQIHQSAVIHESAIIEEGVEIGPNVIIDEQVHIGPKTKIYGNTTIFARCMIGKECLIFSNVTLREGTILHDRVIIQPGAVIGSCGFGYIQNEKGEHIKLEQLGHVEIEEDVEIGANTTIDRARLKKTVIKKGTKIDNLVQIAHNVEIGPHNVLVSQVGIAGSTKTGSHVIFGGQAAAIGHLEICSQTIVAAGSALAQSTLKPGKYAGVPAQDMDAWRRQVVILKKLPDTLKKIYKQIEVLENKLNTALLESKTDSSSLE